MAVFSDVESESVFCAYFTSQLFGFDNVKLKPSFEVQ